MDNKAQPSLEYLLLIAGAVLVAAIVIMTLSSSLVKPENAKATYHNKYNALSNKV
jgi:uncharacterized protein (UPF0333 family)